MKFFKTILILSACLLLTTGISSAQICGDANSDNSLNILDIALSLDFIAGVPNPINLANADCDGVSGVTISDVAALSNNFFRSEPLNCNAAGSYSLTPAVNDTIHIMRVTDAPADVDDVYLLVVGSFSSVASGVYLPIFENGAGSSNLFEISAVYGLTSTLGGGILTEPNKRTLFSAEFSQPDFLNGVQNLLLLKYNRTTPGVGSIFPEAYDRETPWEISIARNDDLFKPVIAYHDLSYPGGILQASEEELHFHALSSSPSLDTFTVVINHGAMPVGFELSSPTPWIEFDQTTGVTPATVTFTADATGLGVLDYNGVVRVSYDGFYQVVDTINLVLTVHPLGNPSFPAGDANCDGALNILDLTYMINYFFRFGTAPFPCEK